MSEFAKRNQITQFLASGYLKEVHFFEEIVKEGDKYILTTDGVHDNLTDGEIEKIVGASSDEASQLVARAKVRSREGALRSKPDDMSAIVFVVERLFPDPQLTSSMKVLLLE